MTPFTSGFASELVKTADKTKFLRSLLSRAAEVVEGVEHNPTIRHSVAKGAILGGTGGALGNLPTGSGKKRERLLKGGIGGALSGAVAGALAPGWFHPASMRLPVSR